MKAISKALAATAAACVVLVGAGVLTSTALTAANVVIAVAAALGVGGVTYAAPANKAG